MSWVRKEGVEQTAALQVHDAELQTKPDSIEEKYFVTGEMSRETFEKFSFSYKGEQATIAKELDGLTKVSSYPAEMIGKAVSMATKPASTWASSDVHEKEKLQELLFPEGVIYDRQIGQRPERVNEFFA